jgi:hypothetical protein
MEPKWVQRSCSRVDMLLTSVRVVARCTEINLQGLPHVVQHISDFLYYNERWQWGIYIAAAGGHLRLLQRLVNQHTPPLRSEDLRFPMYGAVEYGHFPVVQWFFAAFPDLKLPTRLMNVAACEGQLAILQWIHHHTADSCTVEAMDNAARRGDLEMLRFLHTHRTEGCTTRAMDKAAASGHLEIVQFLHENRTEGCTYRALSFAALHGFLEVVVYLHENRSDGDAAEAMHMAAARNHLDVVRYLLQHCPVGSTERAMAAATTLGNAGVVELILEHRTRTSSGADRSLR